MRITARQPVNNHHILVLENIMLFWLDFKRRTRIEDYVKFDFVMADATRTLKHHRTLGMSGFLQEICLLLKNVFFPLQRPAVLAGG